MRAAVLQMQVRDGDAEANRRRAEQLMAGSPDAEVYLLPELWSTGYAHAAWPDSAKYDTPRLKEWMAAQAHTRQATVAGSLVSLADEEEGEVALVNRMWIFPPDGGPPAFYDKAHLFQPLAEHEHLRPGRRRVQVPVGGFKAAPSICFDLRFPEQYRRDAAEGASLFLVSAEWPQPRGEALRLFAKARAVENQAYLLLSNRTGPALDGTVFCGGSVIVSPEGELLAEAREAEGVLTAILSPGRVHALRERFPVLPFRAEGIDF